MRKRISLFFMPDEVMLVIEHPSGVVYGNQVGGSCCIQEEIEGVLVPLDIEATDGVAITQLFNGYRLQGIDAEIANRIDAVLAAQSGAKGIKVDRARLHECWEAWVYVTVDEISELVAWSGFRPAAHGVLTWHNSD